MSTAEILDELPKLSADELRIIREKIDALESNGNAKAQPHGTLGDLIRLRQQYPPDPELADLLEEINRADQPARNPWD